MYQVHGALAGVGSIPVGGIYVLITSKRLLQFRINLSEHRCRLQSILIVFNLGNENAF